MTHPIDVVTQSLELAGHGLSTSEVARRVGVPRATVRDWLAGRLPAGYGRDGTTSGACGACGGVHDLDALPASYVYLLGMYLGDGCLSAHPRGVFKLRISLDARYPGIAEECERAIRAVMPRNRIGHVGYGTWHELFAYSKSWPCLFPQHGPGRKHEREIALTDWQRSLVATLAGAAAARPDPLGRLPLPEHGTGVVTPSLLLRELLGGHQGNLLRGVRPDGPALDEVRCEDDLRLPEGGCRDARPLRRSEELATAASAAASTCRGPRQ